MRSADVLYQVLLRTYPEDFRVRYAHEMTVHFHDMRRDAAGGAVGFWLGIVWDVAKTASVMRLQRAHSWWNRNIHFEEIAVLIMGILSLLVGVLELVNSFIEVRYGVTQGESWPLFAGLDGVFAGALLLAAGVALLRRTSKSVMLARVAALYCLATFGLVLAIRPIFSIAATTLGIAFPIILLAFLYVRGRGSSAPRVA